MESLIIINNRFKIKKKFNSNKMNLSKKMFQKIIPRTIQNNKMIKKLFQMNLNNLNNNNNNNNNNK